MIVVDASALVAIAEREADAAGYARVISEADAAVISSINAVEAGFMLIGRQRLRDVEQLNLWLTELKVAVHGTGPTASGALAAYLRFGRNYHPAGLNLGDCFAYALAKSLDAPLLYKGNDFALTDVKSAL